MNTVLQLSDFALKVSFIDIKGLSLKIKKFKFSYSTPLSPPVVAEFDGVNYSPNCRPEADGVLIIFENPRFNVGQLIAHRTYSIENKLFENGVRESTQVDVLPINIALNYPTETQTPIPRIITADTSGIVFNDNIRTEGFVGNTGNDGANGKDGKDGKNGGVDYAMLTEQAIPGEFWLGSDGVRRQVYTRTFQGAKSPASFSQGIAGQAYSFAWSFYTIGSVNNCQLMMATIGGHDFLDPATNSSNYIWRGLDLWFKEGTNPKFNNVSYVLTFKYTKQ